MACIMYVIYVWYVNDNEYGSHLAMFSLITSILNTEVVQNNSDE